MLMFDWHKDRLFWHTIVCVCVCVCARVCVCVVYLLCFLKLQGKYCFAGCFSRMTWILQLMLF